MAADYYATIGVPHTASDDEIRKAYRELARKYHPDLHPDDATAKKKFQEVQQAFEVLNDPKKRKQYDQFGPNYEKMHAGPGGGPFGGGRPGGGQAFDFDLNDLFGGTAPGGGGGFADLFRNLGGGKRSAERRKAEPQKGADIEHQITVPFSTAVLGGEAAIHIQRPTGKVETLQVKIPAGMEDGKKIRLRGQGELSPRGGADGDVLLTVRVAPHPVFRRSGPRLDVTAPITLAEALEGAKIDIPTPHGKATVSIPPGSSSGKKLRLKGQGVRGAKEPPGDLYVELQIVLPESLTPEERAELVKLAHKPGENPRSALQW